MTIFDVIGSVLITKKYEQLNCDDESQFNAVMMNRWLSFYSKDISTLINNTANMYISQFETKQEQYDYYYHLLPKCRFKKIEYVKKIKKEGAEDKQMVPDFMSQEEFNKYVEFQKSLTT